MLISLVKPDSWFNSFNMPPSVRGIAFPSKRNILSLFLIGRRFDQTFEKENLFFAKLSLFSGTFLLTPQHWFDLTFSWTSKIACWSCWIRSYWIRSCCIKSYWIKSCWIMHQNEVSTSYLIRRSGRNWSPHLISIPVRWACIAERALILFL